jgi:transposase
MKLFGRSVRENHMLTREQFQTLYDQGPDVLFDLFTAMQAQIDALSARVKELEDRLAADSHNSSKPPSSDGFKKPVSLREKTGRKPGGQKGHSGRTLAFSENPDEIMVHSPPACACCGKALDAVEGTEIERRQVVDLPPLSLVTREHRVQQKVCPDCGFATMAAFPAEAQTKVQYGPRLKALGVYLLDFQLLPYQRLAALLADLFDASFSAGTLFACQQTASARLLSVLSSIRRGLRQAPVAHFDETGVHLGGKLHWLHSASTPTLTYYDWHQRRGKAGMDKAAILPHWRGIAVHDGWSSYAYYPCLHVLCNAHHLRELTALFEQDGQEWAAKMRSLLVEIKKAVERAKEQGRSCLSPLLAMRFEARYKRLLAEGFAANAPPEALPGKRGRPKQSRGRNLLDRLQQGREATLRFMSDFRVPFDNNLAERDIRMMKVQQKVSGGFRSEDGVTAFCRIRSYLSTMRKQGHCILSALEHVFRGTPLCPQTQG